MKQGSIAARVCFLLPFATAALLAGLASTGCLTRCAANEQSEVLVRVFERSGRLSTAAVVTASGTRCGLDTYEPNSNRYRCIVDPGGDVDIEASLDGHTAATKIEATQDTCAGETAPPTSVDLTP